MAAEKLTQDVLDYLDANAELDSLKYAEKVNLDHQKIIGAIKGLQMREDVSRFLFLLLFAFVSYIQGCQCVRQHH